MLREQDRIDAGWSSPVARQAHNLKVTGSNPVPAPKHGKAPGPGNGTWGFFCFGMPQGQISELSVTSCKQVRVIRIAGVDYLKAMSLCVPLYPGDMCVFTSLVVALSVIAPSRCALGR